MNDIRKPRLTSGGAHRAETRQERLAKALRENLVKRKAQQRARDAAETPPASLPGSGSDVER